ncbi:MAG: hypothetical protein Q7O04_06690 [Candidatus Omnitrophota bacterium]|nr:hypothetical protein [Candidatus Omnitrophota bacterium]
MRELEKYGVLEIKRARIAKGVGHENREPSEYLLGILYSEKDMEKKWLGMEKLYGKDTVAKAREFSFMIDKGYSPKVVENFIRIMKEYNENDVRKAVEKVSSMRPDNPLRNIRIFSGDFEERSKRLMNHLRGLFIFKIFERKHL